MGRRPVLLVATSLFVAACSLDTEGLPGESPDATVRGPEAGGGDGPAFDIGDPEGVVLDDASHPLRDARGGGDGRAADSGGPGDSSTLSDTSTGADSGGGTLDSGFDVGDVALPDAGFAFTCGSITVPDCASCPGAPVGCLWCTISAFDAFCIPDGKSCSSYAPGGSHACGCTSPAAFECLDESQTCVMDKCEACGEMGTDMKRCRGGQKCDEAQAKCK